MRVAFDVRPLQYPGAHRGIARYVRHLLPALSRANLEVHLLADPGLALPEEASGFPLLEVSKRPRIPRQLGWLADELASWDGFPVDLIHLTSPFDLNYGWPLRCKIPKVATVYDFFALELPLPGWRRLARPIYRWLLWKLGSVERAICISNYTRQRAEAWLGPCLSMSVTPLGVACPSPPGCLPSKCPQRFLLIVPCWPRHKNVEAVVQALRTTGIPLVIAGDCPENFRSQVQAMAGDLPLLWTGRVSDSQLNALYAACAGFVFPSLHEGFGLTVLEAMSYGAPVAVSDLAPMNEIVTRPELRFNPYEPESIRRTCLSLWESPRVAEWRTWSSEQARRYTWDVTADLTVAAYASALALPLGPKKTSAS